MDDVKRVVPVTYEALILAFQNERPEQQRYLDVETGDVFPVAGPNDEDYAEVQAGLGKRFLAVPVSDGDELDQDMVDFAARMTVTGLEAALLAAKDEGGVQAFRKALYEYPSERGGWFGFRDVRLLVRVMAWMESQGIESDGKCTCGHHD